MEGILQLVTNPLDVFDETTRLLLKIADNILASPNSVKVRILQKSNETVQKKILNVNGGRACLNAMGFEENEQTFMLPTTDPLHNLRRIRAEIDKLKNGNKSETLPANTDAFVPEPIIDEPKTENTLTDDKVQSRNGFVTEQFKRIELPAYMSVFTNPFLKEIETYFHRARYYENSYLQQRALSVIPLKELEYKAQEGLRSLQLRIKKEKLEDAEISLQDFLILELLAWFKEDFFEWVNNPACLQCDGETKFSHMSSDTELLKYATRVEMHKCLTCSALTSFPRYNDLNILLETRKGRCGEWAQTFTLMCRAMGWDARFVLDQTDHVWTEVYSFGQRRWLHCDACENACDNPLMYETGWKKEVSYVVAFSGEEVQDVTWRYTSKHKEVLKRRTKCAEAELVRAMDVLREGRQAAFSQSRRDYLNKRFLSECVELMVEKQPTDGARQGRASGSLDWRQSRGETQERMASHVWEFSSSDVRKDFVVVQYSSALNQYQKVDSDGQTTTISGWEGGAFESEGVFRKVESDWKKSYLCRKESSTSARITWKFNICDKKYSFDAIDYAIERVTFENGAATAKICSDSGCVLVTSDKGTTKDLSGSSEVSVTVQLFGGKGNAAWQHAQICREDLNSNEFSFKIKFSFRKAQ